MRRLLLLRHAKSDWNDAALTDYERPLNSRGKQAAPEIGAHMARHGLVPDKILCSTAQRARETLSLILPHLSGEMDVQMTRSLYDDSEVDYVDTIRAKGAAARTLLVIGHNPAMQETALELIGSGNETLVASIAGKYPTAALVVIDFALDHWDAIDRASGRVVAYCLPRHLPTQGTISALPLAANDGGTPATQTQDRS